MRLLLIAMPPLLSGCWATKPGMIVNGFSWVLYFCLNAAPRLMEDTAGAASIAPGAPEPEASMPRNRCTVEQGLWCGEGPHQAQETERLKCKNEEEDTQYRTVLHLLCTAQESDGYCNTNTRFNTYQSS